MPVGTLAAQAMQLTPGSARNWLHTVSGVSIGGCSATYAAAAGQTADEARGILRQTLARTTGQCQFAG